MPVAIRVITRLQDADDVSVSLGAGVDEYALCWDQDTAKFVLRAVAGGGVTDHGALTGLADDDHTQYALLAGRAGGTTLYGGTAANEDITIHGTSNATRTTSYVLLQPTAGNVGIGTASPTLGTLQIAGTGDWTGVFLSGGTDQRIQFYPSASANIGFYGLVTFLSCTVAGLTSLRSGTGQNINITPGAGGVVELGGASLTVPNLIVNPTGDNYIQFNESGVAARWRIGDAAGSGTFQFCAGQVLGTNTRWSLTSDGIAALAAVTAATNAVTNVVTIGHDTSDTAAAGFGAGQLFKIESSTTAAQAAARIQALWYEATHATRKADLVLTAYDTAEREGLRIRGNGSAPAIGFLGAAPQARIAHVADPAGGGTVDAEARSAINSILTTLENFGFHATS